MLAIIPLLALVVLLGLGAFGVLAGAVVVVIPAPAERPVELPHRAAGMALALISLIVFVASANLIAGQIA